MRYVTITVACIRPFDLAQGASYQDASDELMGEVFSMWEDAKDVRIHIQPMPPEYNRLMAESDEAKQEIEEDSDQGFSLGGALMGEAKVRHPYEDGVWIFPEDHPLAAAERMAAAKGDHEVLNELAAAAPKLKELPRGSE